MSRRLTALTLVLHVLLTPTTLPAQPSAHWRLDGEPGAPAPADGLQAPGGWPAVPQGAGRGGAPEFAGEVPGEYVYDPLTGASARNTSSLRFAAGGFLEVPPDRAEKLAGDGGLTLELFLKPGAVETAPGDVIPVLSKDRRGGGAAGCEIFLYRSPPPHSYNWWEAAFTEADGGRTVLSRNEYQGITSLTDEYWRHLALVYDPRAGSVAFYVDYTLIDSAPAEKLSWGGGPFWVGGRPGGKGFTGLIDEVRVTGKALKPWEFIRATPHDLRGVSFEPRPGLLPADAGQADLRLRFGAVGDGRTDDTLAFQRAVRELDDRVPITYNTLRVPAGTYLVSDTVAWDRFLVVQGDGRGKTVIRLKDGCGGFGDPARAKPVLLCSNWRGGGGGSGSAMGNYIFDLTVDTGKDNPGAVGIEYHTNNHGAVENVTVRSGDGAGVAGLDCSRPWPGPCLIQGLRVEGFDTGVRTRHREYSLVLVDVELAGQNVAGIDNEDNVLSIERLRSRNSVPVIWNRGGGLVTVIDSQFTGGGGGACAVENRAALYARNVTAEGYKSAVEDGGKVVGGSRVGEYVAGAVKRLFPSPPKSLGLPVERRPEVPWGEPADWVNVRDYAHLVREGDWGPALQAAVDSGKSTVYFPPGGYNFATPVEVRGNVRRLFGMKVGLAADDRLAGRPLLVLGDGLKGALSLERLHVASARHDSRHDLIVRHGTVGDLQAGPGCGRLFLEDVEGKWRLNRHQRVWGRQLNPETRGVPEIVNDGGQLWVLGLKTEYPSVNIENRNGARTEVLGGLIYPVEQPPEDMPMFINDESSMSLIHAVSAYPANHKVYMRETRGGVTRELENGLQWVAGRPLMQLYTGYPAKE